MSEVKLMLLAEKRVAFTLAVGKLLAFASERGYQLAFGEGYVALTDARDGDYDGPHKKGGAHYTGLGVDLILYRRLVPGGRLVPVTNGGDPVWLELGEFWEKLHELARWGGRFQDANHFSFEHEGVK